MQEHQQNEKRKRKKKLSLIVDLEGQHEDTVIKHI
jgi:hypothetical protein